MKYFDYLKFIMYIRQMHILAPKRYKGHSQFRSFFCITN